MQTSLGKRSLSIWDVMCRQPGKIWEDNTGDVACDHYHRYAEDARLMGELGLKAYRLSISWPRVIPEGVGVIDPKGIDFYDRLMPNARFVSLPGLGHYQVPDRSDLVLPHIKEFLAEVSGATRF